MSIYIVLCLCINLVACLLVLLACVVCLLACLLAWSAGWLVGGFLLVGCWFAGCLVVCTCYHSTSPSTKLDGFPPVGGDGFPHAALGGKTCYCSLPSHPIPSIHSSHPIPSYPIHPSIHPCVVSPRHTREGTAGFPQLSQAHRCSQVARCVQWENRWLRPFLGPEIQLDVEPWPCQASHVPLLATEMHVRIEVTRSSSIALTRRWTAAWPDLPPKSVAHTPRSPKT